MTETPTPCTILDPGATPLLRLVQHSTTSILLQSYGPGTTYDQIELDDATMQAFLRALPRRTLLAALRANVEAEDAEAEAHAAVLTPSPGAAYAAWLAAQAVIDQDALAAQQDPGATLALDLDTLPDDAPLPLALPLDAPPWFRQPGTVCAASREETAP